MLKRVIEWLVTRDELWLAIITVALSGVLVIGSREINLSVEERVIVALGICAIVFGALYSWQRYKLKSRNRFDHNLMRSLRHLTAILIDDVRLQRANPVQFQSHIHEFRAFANPFRGNRDIWSLIEPLEVACVRHFEGLQAQLADRSQPVPEGRDVIEAADELLEFTASAATDPAWTNKR